MAAASQVVGESKIPQVSFEISVTRADGRVEDMGVRSYYHKNPFRQAAVQTLIDRNERITQDEINSTSTLALLVRAARSPKGK